MANLNLNEILAVVDETAKTHALTQKNTNLLRLLAEEGFNMIGTLLNNPKCDFSIDKKDCFSMHFSVSAVVYTKYKKEFLALASDNKNFYNKGLMGKIGAVIDSLFSKYDESSASIAEYHSSATYSRHSVVDYQNTWSMNNYLQSISEVARKEAWDELEKSILVNLSDDILVGANSNRVEIIIKKTF